MSAPFTHCGKQVLSNGVHYCDAADVRAAGFICDALNAHACGWQPISTAPRDGSRFLAGRFTGRGDKHDGLIRTDRWHDRSKDGYEGLGGFHAKFWPATHWMPLQSAPATTNAVEAV